MRAPPVERELTGSAPRTPQPCIAFVHIPKNAGSTVTWLLRHYFGTAHCRVVASNNREYSLRDWQEDRWIYPSIRCISGHRLRPHVRFGPQDDLFQWATVLRDPRKRFVSQYQWYCAKRKLPWTFSHWCHRKGAQFADFQTRWLCGQPNAQAAWDVLHRKRVLVGDQADLNSFLRALATRAGLSNFPTSANRRVNRAVVWSPAKSAVDPEDPSTQRLVESFNQADIELYDRCVAEGRFDLAWPPCPILGEAERPPSGAVPYWSNLAKHVALYKPYKRLRSWSNPRR